MSSNEKQVVGSLRSRDKESNAASSEDQLLTKSPGVLRIEAISNSFNLLLSIALFKAIFILSYVYRLDGSVRSTFQAEATNSFRNLPLLSTVATVRSVVAAAGQPAYGRIADVFGRIELLTVSAILYVIGTVIESVANNVETFASGAILYQLGMSGVQLLVKIIIADVTTLRNRLLLSWIPATPFIINVWISGNFAEAVLESTTWRWGVGMFAIILPAVTLPVIGVLWVAARRAKRQGKLVGLKSLRQLHGSYRALWLDIFWRTDFVGLVLITASLSLVLLPLTLAGGEDSRWAKAYIITMLILGVLLVPVLITWEQKFTRFPILPVHLLKDRTILASLACALAYNCAWYLQGDYLYTILRVSFNQSVLNATRISYIYSFASAIAGVVVGLIVRYVRYLKWAIIVGVLIFTTGMGILVKYRGTGGSGETAGMIGCQVLLGVAGGFFTYSVQAMVQTATNHEHLALVTSLYLAVYNVGSSLGAAISGAIWTNTLPEKLNEYMGNSTLVAQAYRAPLSFILSHPVGTEVRDQMVHAYNDTQRYLCITGVCLCVPLLASTLALRNPRLEDKQSLDDAEVKYVKNGAEVKEQKA